MRQEKKRETLIKSLRSASMAYGDLTGRTLGEFVLEERLVEGGNGVVYRARQPALGRDVVVKVLGTQHQYSSVARERFLREAHLASLLEHPYAAHVYAFGVDETDRPWIAMELVHGVTLRERLATRGPMSLDQLVPFIERVAQVVHAAHERGIVHRDLKPSNIMVHEQGDSLLPKLLDFGIAKAPADLALLPSSTDATRAADANATSARLREALRDEPITDTSSAEDSDSDGLTPSGACIGSSAYMSPEQWHNDSVGRASDIYALGVIVYRVLSGKEPFTGERTGGYYRQHMDAVPPQLGGELALVDRVIQRALTKSPGDRHATALDFAADLRAALRVSEREQLRTAAQQWDDRKRSPGLLWGQGELPELERWTHRAPGQLSALECSFVAASQRRARHALWWRRVAIVAGVAVILGGFEYRNVIERRAAEAIAINAEVEEGRHALLHGELEDARSHLLEAIKRGDTTASTAWMLERAELPRRAELAAIPATHGRGLGIAWSKDGARVATADDAGAALWDPVDNHRVAALDVTGPVHALAYAPNGDLLATASDRIRIWTSTGVLVRELTAGGPGSAYRAIAWSSDGLLLAAVDPKRGVLSRWNVTTGASAGDVELGEGAQSSIAAGAHWITATAGDRTVAVDGRNSLTFPVSNARVLAQEPAGDHIAIATALGDLAIWDVPTRSPAVRLRQIGISINDLAWSRDGEHLAVAAGDTIEIWATHSGQLESTTRTTASAFVVAWGGDTNRLAVGLVSGDLVVLDTRLGTTLTVLQGHKGIAVAAGWNPNGDRLASASVDGTFRIWNAHAAYRRWQTEALNDDCGVVPSAMPDDRYTIVPCVGSPTRVWDTLHDRLLAELPAIAENDGVAPLPVVSPDGTRAAIARGMRAEIYALPGGKLVQSIEHSAAVTALAWGPAGLVSGDGSGSVDGREVGRGAVDALATLPDGRVVVADANRGLAVVGAWHGEMAARARLLRVSPDGQRVLVATSTRAPPELWDVSSGRHIATLDGHTGRVWSGRWTTDGELLTTSADGSVRRWTRDGVLRMTYASRGVVITDAVENARLIVGAGQDGVLRWWDRATGHQLWSLAVGSPGLVGLSVGECGIVVRDVRGAVSRWGLRMPDGSSRDCDMVGR